MTTDNLSVLIPDGESDLALFVARCLAQVPNLQTYVLSSEPWAPVRFSRHHRLYKFKSIGTDYEERLKSAVEIIKRFNIDVILPVSEEGAEFVAAKHQALSEMVAISPIPDLQSLKIARNKWLLNQFASEQRLPTPSSILVTLGSAFDQRISALEYPVLLKPTSLTDGPGIRRFDTLSDLRRFLKGQDGTLFKDKYLVQTYVPGSDLGLSVLCQDGEILAFTVQHNIISGPHRFGPPMAMELIRQDDVLDIGRKLLSALRWSGVAHIDFRRDSRDGQAKIIEVNARYWRSLLGSLVAGVNFPYLACLTARGVSFPMPKYQLSKYAHTTTAIKEGLLWFLGKSSLKGFTFRKTGLRFFLTDPLPEVVKRFQELKFIGK